MKNEKNIVLFDGVCNLCNSSVNYILKRDPKNRFLFASLQSDAAKKLLLQLNDEKLKNNLDSIIFIENNKVYSKSNAILRIAKILGFPYNLAYVFIIIPKFIRNNIYDTIAANRYNWFGKKESCMIPTKEYLDRFLT